MNTARTLSAVVAISLGLLIPTSAIAQSLSVVLAPKSTAPGTTQIAPPSASWKYSALAPVAGNTWNQVKRPDAISVTDPSKVEDPTLGPGVLGSFPLSTANALPLVDVNGAKTSAMLTVSLGVNALATDKARKEPSFPSRSKDAVPKGLMDGNWRLIVGANTLNFSIAGLKASQMYDLYLYAAAYDPDNQDNPMGDGLGARLTIAPSNVTSPSQKTSETLGGSQACLYNVAADGTVTPSPAGTTWTKLRVVADTDGVVAFNTAMNSKRNHYVNGFQLVEVRW